MRLLHSIASFVSWHRRAVGGLLAGGAVLLVAQSLTAPPTDTVTVVVTAADLPAGHLLTPTDVRLADLVGVPSGAVAETADVVGQTTSVALNAGTILQGGFLAGAQSVESGRALVPISIRDAELRALLNPGDKVTLIAVGAESADVLSSDVRVATVPQPATATGISLGGGTASTLVMVDVPADQAPVIAALGQGGQLNIVLGGL